MTMSFCVLGSGSGGNSTLVICGGMPLNHAAANGARPRGLLIDCGLSPRATVHRLAIVGFTLDDITAILLTHFDTDHFYAGWLKIIERRNLPVYVHRRHRTAAWRAGLTARQAALFDGDIALDCGVTASPVLLAHDDLGSVGFVLEHQGLRLGYATDLGCVPHELLQHFTNLDALAIESNYDREMQLASDRPIFLKRRIMGGRGHLSNAQSLEAAFRIAEQSSLSHVAALHLSRQCNDPRRVRALYEREAPHLVDRLTITNQYKPTPLLNVTRSTSLAPRAAQGRISHRRIALEPLDQIADSHRQLRLFTDATAPDAALTA